MSALPGPKGSVFSAIGRGINSVISAIACVFMAIVVAITNVTVTIFNVITNILCCRCGKRRSGCRCKSYTVPHLLSIICKEFTPAHIILQFAGKPPKHFCKGIQAHQIWFTS
ncbi:hypothetical protein BDV98DRAFT_597588 [Pterulicium gracile]|uniref:Uncharacterized protein n=1 Tax=Pterulicium gracile TaxID=1884261 RepID=A0A5C3Q896_9AGAR|nr:hypothetical protein BDV98DRAFT_597588 [Pterula gracilis]